MKTRLTILLLLPIVLLQAQENYMSLSFGTASPLGDFGKNKSLLSDGYANFGFMADYSGAYYLYNYLGIAGSIKFNQNSIDKTDVETQLLELIPLETTDTITRIDLGYWSNVSFSVGPQFTFPVGRFNFDLYFMPGLHINTPPKMELAAIIDNVPYNTSVSAQNIRFGFETGASIRISLGTNAGIRVFASYLQTSSKGEILSKIGDDASANTTTDFSRKIQIVNTGIGIYYVL
jgi:hypothetical protein